MTYAATLLAAFDADKSKIVRFDIIDNHTSLVVGSAKTRAKAMQSADKRDNAYGAVRFSVKAIYA